MEPLVAQEARRLRRQAVISGSGTVEKWKEGLYAAIKDACDKKNYKTIEWSHSLGNQDPEVKQTFIELRAMGYEVTTGTALRGYVSEDTVIISWAVPVEKVKDPWWLQPWDKAICIIMPIVLIAVAFWENW